ncbi:MAG: hypothetical protein KGI06_02520 [Candidatus Micrarchaeota archaeon]|nr:hypothetical protein [Candidatus Micrarchaeota archaeon]
MATALLRPARSEDLADYLVYCIRSGGKITHVNDYSFENAQKNMPKPEKVTALLPLLDPSCSLPELHELARLTESMSAGSRRQLEGLKRREDDITKWLVPEAPEEIRRQIDSISRKMTREEKEKVIETQNHTLLIFDSEVYRLQRVLSPGDAKTLATFMNNFYYAEKSCEIVGELCGNDAINVIVPRNLTVTTLESSHNRIMRMKSPLESAFNPVYVDIPAIMDKKGIHLGIQHLDPRIHSQWGEFARCAKMYEARMAMPANASGHARPWYTRLKEMLG